MSEVRFPITDGSEGYLYIFTGTGCAALSLVMRMIKSGTFRDRKILLIDKEPKIKNDRTWCFWEKDNGFFEEIVYKKWNRLSLYSTEFSKTMDISPYQYKMIRGIDFYNYCFSEIARQPNIDIIYGEVKSVAYDKDGLSIKLEDRGFRFDFAWVLNSLNNIGDPKAGSKKDISLLQHFKGWIIETPTTAFDPDEASFMDFRVDQKWGTAFAYVLPFTEKKALVEYTFLTKEILHEDVYNEGLRYYISEVLKISDYNIVDKEAGVIPMTTKPFVFYNKPIYHLGTVGGQTKASTGYTFQFIQKQSELVLRQLQRNKILFQIPSAPKRFQFYDKVLLDVLCNNRASGKQIFTTLFKKNKPQQVLKFLDNESTLKEELKIISTLPTLPFLKAAINQL